MSLNAYINDASLVGQFQPMNSVEAIGNVREMVSFLRKNPHCALYWNSSALFGAMVEQGRTFGQIMDTHRDLKSYWRTLTCNHVDSTVQSAADNTASGIDAGLISFILSPFSEPTTACGTQNIDVRVFLNKDSLSAYLLQHHYLLVDYPDDATYPPRDEQTILSDTSLFELTARINRHRKVYRRLDKDEWWCADNQHHGADAELEVFQMSDGKHIATCGIKNIATYHPDGNEKKYRNRYIDNK